MTINLQKPDITELKPKITVFGVGGGGGNAVNNMITGGLEGVEFVVANTDAQALTMSQAEKVVQMGVAVTEGLGAGSQPEVGRSAAEECIDEIRDFLNGTHMAFVTAGMGGGTGTGAAPVVARAARELGILTVGVVTKPFDFEGKRRMATAETGITELGQNVDTLIVIPNQNLFRIANDKTTFADAFSMADQVLYSGVACITDLMVKEGLINLDFADVRSVMREMGRAMMGTGEATGEGRAMQAAEAAISNPLLDETTMRGAQGLLISITGGCDLTLFEVDEAATRIREEVDADANIILGATFDEGLEGVIRVSVVATGLENGAGVATQSGHSASVLTGRQLGDGLAITPGRPGRQIPLAATNQQRPTADATKVAQEHKGAEIAHSLEISVADSGPVLGSQGIELQRFKPEQEMFDDAALEDEFRAALEEELMPPGSPYIPPKPTMPHGAVRNTLIPAVEEFPPTVMAELTRRTNSAATEEETGGAKGLLRRLKSGFGGREESFAGLDMANAAAMAPQEPVPDLGDPVVPPMAAPPQRLEQVMPETAQIAPAREDNNPYAPKRTGLDLHGRIATTEKSANEEDQLDIPAFLRRQAT